MILPVALNVQGRRILIVGGGAVAARKAALFVESGARVVVVAPELKSEFPPVEYLAKWYEKIDLTNCSLVCACTNSREVNAAVALDAREAGIWCNIADDPESSDFHTAAIVRRDEIGIGITTGGTSPVLSRHLKKKVEESVGPEYAELLKIARSYRIETKKRGDTWREILESEILLLLKSGKRDEAVALLGSLLAKTG